MNYLNKANNIMINGMTKTYEFDGKEFKHYSLFNCPSAIEPNRMKISKNSAPITYVNNVVTLDIETTSFDMGEDRLATMYIWQMSVEGVVETQYIWGRTWEELGYVFDTLKRVWNLSVEENRLCQVFIHNLSFEFGFFLKNPIFNWTQMFLRDKGHPMYVVDHRGIQFRCSYIMCNYSLSTLADTIKCPFEKLKGDLDYEVIRHYNSPLTYEEMHYCFNDVAILDYYIKSLRDKYLDIWCIPLTQTGVVRNAVREKCKESDKYFSSRIRPQHPDEDVYNKLKECYQGGFTHANYKYVDTIVDDLTCVDFASSYPASMFRLIPMGKWYKCEKPTLSEVMRLLKSKRYALMITLTVKNVVKKTSHSIISASKCLYMDRKSTRLDNGKVWKSDMLQLALTDYDFRLLMMYYKIGEIRVDSIYFCKYGYLPKPIIESVLDFYEAKTKLKGIEDRYDEYMNGKQCVNGIYGMCVTDCVNTDIEWNGVEWIESMVKSASEQLEDYANSWNTFLVYAWGVWITAISRYNLLSSLYEMSINGNDDGVYCDTDSIKYIHGEKYVDMIENYNKRNCEIIEKCLNYHKIPLERYKPKTVKGVEKTLGVFEYEHNDSKSGRLAGYKHFITQGAKKYCVEYFDGTFEMTVAGCGKKAGMKYLEELAKDKGISPLELFKDGFEFDEEHSGRMTAIHSYEHFICNLTDFMGETVEVEEWSFIAFSKTTYTLGKTQEFIAYIMGMYEEVSNNTKYMEGQKYGKIKRVKEEK